MGRSRVRLSQRDREAPMITMKRTNFTCCLEEVTPVGGGFMIEGAEA